MQAKITDNQKLQETIGKLQKQVTWWGDWLSIDRGLEGDNQQQEEVGTIGSGSVWRQIIGERQWDASAERDDQEHQVVA